MKRRRTRPTPPRRLEQSAPVGAPTRRRGPLAWAWLLLILLACRPVLGQTVVLSENFESTFPGGWTVVDNNPADGAYTWRDVNSGFGGEGTHAGSWKGYCAGTRFPFNFTELAPVYTNNMAAVMSRSIDLSAFPAAQLTFWYKVPTIEAGFDYCRVFIDGTKIWELNSPVAAWTQATLSLNSYAGGTHTLAFEFDSDGTVVNEGWYLDDIQVLGFTPPANDDFANAIVISGTAGTVGGNTLLATKQAGEPNHAGNAGGHSIWYAWTAPSSGPFTFFTQGSAFDTLLAAYTGASVSTLTAIAANDDIPGGTWSGVTIDAVSGTTYYLAIDGYNGANGNVTLSWLQPSVSETILSAAVGNYTGYVIDSDADNP